MPDAEAVSLCRQLAADPETRLGAAMYGLIHPISFAMSALIGSFSGTRYWPEKPEIAEARAEAQKQADIDRFERRYAEFEARNN